MVLLGIWGKELFFFRIFLARRNGRSRLAKRSLVYIPPYSPSQQVSFDTTNQFQERWSGEELKKFKHFSDVYSNSLDLFDRVNSATSVTARRLCVYFFPPQNICHILVLKNRPPQLPAGNPRCHTSSTQYLAIRNWQPLNCHSAKRLRLNKTCQAKQAGV